MSINNKSYTKKHSQSSSLFGHISENTLEDAVNDKSKQGETKYNKVGTMTRIYISTDFISIAQDSRYLAHIYLGNILRPTQLYALTMQGLDEGQ